MSDRPEQRAKSKTRKVLSVVGRPVRGVGRRLGFKNNKTHRHGAVTSTLPEDVGSDVESDSSSDDNRLVARSRHEEQSGGGVAGILQRRFSSADPTSSHAWIVVCLEGRLRYLSLIFAAYLIGTYSGQYAWAVTKLLEYTAIAWVTCVMILLVGDYYQKKLLDEQQEAQQNQLALSRSEKQSRLLDHGDTLDTTMDVPDEPETNMMELPPVMPHPALENYFVIDCTTMERIVPNTEATYKLETEYFSGEMMLLIRTPDCDDSSAVSTPETLAASSYLRDKQRRFEFQFQIKLKKIPTGRVYFSCELDKAVKMGIIQRAFVGAAMAFVKTTNNNFHYSLQGNADGSKEEKPHMAFPVEEGMNRVVATPFGDPVPKLGEEIIEDVEHYKRRRKGEQIAWKMDATYTLSLWSAYVDFLDWRCINLPGIRPFQLSNVIGMQPITLTLYEIPEERGTDKHYKEDMKQIVEIELSNSAESGLGPAAKHWMQQQGAKLLPRRGSENDLPVFITSQFAKQQADVKIVEDKIAEEEDVAELGEGIYVCSGDAINLREILLNQESEQAEDQSCFLTYGAEYVILQEFSSSSSPANITIEKVTKSRKPAASPLIKNGDTVIFKLHVKRKQDGKSKTDGSGTRYLTVHKGWWLKWNHLSKSAHFVVHTCDDFGDQECDEVRSRDTQSSLLTFGGAFHISSKKWPKYQVGVAAIGSATYGGRMLGLYSQQNGQHMKLEDDELEDDIAVEDIPVAKCEWLQPLLLRASEPAPMGTTAAQTCSESGIGATSHGSYSWLTFSSEGYRMDVPAWVETMNRSDRIRQLTYVVRVSRQDVSLATGQEGKDDNDVHGPFMRLRTGRELSQVVRAGLAWRNRTSSTRNASTVGAHATPWTLSPGIDRSTISFDGGRASFDDSYNGPEELESAQYSVSIGEGDSSAEWFPDSDDEGPDGGYDYEQSEPQLGPNRVKRTAQLVGKLSKQTGKSVVATGKSAVRQGVRVGKGTVNASVKVTKGTVTAGAKVGKSAVRAGVKMTRGTVNVSKKAGKAIIAPRSKKPPSKEPKFNMSKSDLDRGLSDLHLAAKKQNRLFSMTDFPSVIAGELSGPEQSCRTVSNMLLKMSSLPPESPYSSNFNALLALQVHQQSDQDSLFLTGGAVQIGANPRLAKIDRDFCDCLVARCLWESHWREELCRVTAAGLFFYAPLTDTPCLEIPIEDVNAVRIMEPHSSPLPGYPMLAIDTAWTCHYMVFANDEARQGFQKNTADVLEAFVLHPASKATKELAQARFWQGFQNSVESSLSAGRGKWGDVNSGGKSKPRTILNNRRSAFDLPTRDSVPERFVEDLLASSLSFSLEHLKQRPEDLVEFLDATCHLRNFDLADIDLSTPAAFCLIVNIYHCLLQHALLLSLNGPLTKRSFGHFLRTSCYEIGKDVFSLAELHSCVIRGNMSRPVSTKFPAVEPPKKSDVYRFYALGQTTPRVNFLLNTGDIAFTRDVSILVPNRLEDQLTKQTATFLRRNTRVDPIKRVVILPKVCETYRHDFTRESTGAALAILKYCLPFFDDETASAIERLQSADRDAPLTIKFAASSESFHSTLTRSVDSCE